MAAMAEFKSDADLTAALAQLCNYTKQAFCEPQLDRRFIIGFTLCLDKLNVSYSTEVVFLQLKNR